MAASNAPKPAGERKRRAAPARGEWQPTDGVGWQGAEVPACPDGLLEPSRDAWSTWMGAWFAANWSEVDLPGLRQVIRLYDQVERGEFQRAAELRLQMDTYGITPKGQQDRRWMQQAKPEPRSSSGTSQRYGHLKAVGD
jgi:hypothetical protein